MNEARFQTAGLSDLTLKITECWLDSNSICFLVATAVKTRYGVSDTQ